MGVAEKIEKVDPEAFLESLLNEQQEITVVERFSQKHSAHDIPAQERYYKDLIPVGMPGEGQQLSFKVDLDRCSGCKACVTACHNLNGLDEGETWRSVGLLIGGCSEEPLQQHVTTACHHCLEPACSEGCPVNAYEKDEQTGIVKHLDDQCIGCQYCVLKCPYDVPKYHKEKGIVRKCDMCSSRLKEGEAPACVQSCPTQAISIVIVDKEKVIDDSQAGSVVPGAAASDYTMPTTEYVSKKELPKNVLPGDYYRQKPEHSHPPLIIMLVLTQLSVGAFFVELMLSLFMEHSLIISLRPVYSVVALVLGIIAVNAAIFHIGRPLYAWRAILGLKKSWLSREVAVFGLFAGLAHLYAFVFWIDKVEALTGLALPAFLSSELLKTSLGISVAASGLLGVFCSVMIYGTCRREFWRESITGIKFFGTTLLLGLSTLIAVTVLGLSFYNELSTLQNFKVFGSQLCILLIVITACKLIWELSIFRFLKDRTHSSMKRTALLMIRDLKQVTRIRFLTGVIGGIIIPAFICLYANGNNNFNGLIVLSLLSLAFCLAGELAERYLYFTAVVRNKMPGGI